LPDAVTDAEVNAVAKHTAQLNIGSTNNLPQLT